MVKVFHKLTSRVTLVFLVDYPTPQSAALLGECRMRQFCHRHSFRGGKSAAALIKRLRAAPAAANWDSPVSPETSEPGLIVETEEGRHCGNEEVSAGANVSARCGCIERRIRSRYSGGWPSS